MSNDLQCNHCDYILDDASAKLRHFEDGDRCPKCYYGSLQIKKTSILPCIWGGWSSESLEGMVCPFCKGQLIIVPREGHLNSRFWDSDHLTDEFPFCCPNDCLSTGKGKYVKPTIRLMRRPA